MIKKDEKKGTTNRQLNNLYNLSMYPRAYMKNGDENAGLMLSGYRVNDKRTKEYVNIWVRPGDYSVREAKDGSYMVTLRAVDVQIVHKGEGDVESEFQ